MPINALSSQLKSLYKTLSPAKRLTLAVFVGGTIAAFILLILWTGRPDFQVLYSNLPPEDAGAILAKLQEQKIPYKTSSIGNSILIPVERIYEVRLQLASEGLPQGSGVGFEIFDNTKLGMTEFVQNVNYQRALQGELSRTINGFYEVETSRVHIVLPPKTLFIEEQTPATASVILKLRSGRSLRKDQIQAVVHLVSSGVSGLKPEDVTVVDSHGKMLAGPRGKDSMEQADSDQFVLQEKMEKGLENSIQTMLETALGPGKAIVRVACALDFRREEKTEEKFLPDRQAIRSEQLFNESSNGSETSSAEGVPGVLSNTPQGQSVEAETGDSAPGKNQSFQKTERTVNYEISKVTSHIVEPSARFKRLSVAVIVDGIRKRVTPEGGKEELKYFPRTDEEMAKLKKIVKRAVNYDPERGDQIEVVNIPFENLAISLEGEGGVQKGWLSYAKQFAPSMKLVSLGVFLFLSFFFVIRPLVRWLTSSSAGDETVLTQLPKTLAEIEGEYGRGHASSDEAIRLLTSDQDQSLELMKDWLTKEEA